RRVDLRQVMQQSHLRGVLSARNVEVSATPSVPVQRAPSASTRPNEPLFTRWIEAKYRNAPIQRTARAADHRPGRMLTLRNSRCLGLRLLLTGSAGAMLTKLSALRGPLAADGAGRVPG